MVARLLASVLGVIAFQTRVAGDAAAVPAGSYALFTIPGESEWTVIPSKVVKDPWGSCAKNPKDDQARVKVTPVAVAEPLETMSIGLQDIRGGKVNLVIAWEKTKVPVELDTELAAKAQGELKAEYTRLSENLIAGLK
ncbi:MAG TPA: DUF2911 domain-containing protein [Candidatus Polarisedimenticolaceae bacterium]